MSGGLVLLLCSGSLYMYSCSGVSFGLSHGLGMN